MLPNSGDTILNCPIRLTRHPRNQRQRRLRVGIDHPEHCPRRGIGRAAVLFPVAHGGELQAASRTLTWPTPSCRAPILISISCPSARRHSSSLVWLMSPSLPLRTSESFGCEIGRRAAASRCVAAQVGKRPLQALGQLGLDDEARIQPQFVENALARGCQMAVHRRHLYRNWYKRGKNGSISGASMPSRRTRSEPQRKVSPFTASANGKGGDEEHCGRSISQALWAGTVSGAHSLLEGERGSQAGDAHRSHGWLWKTNHVALRRGIPCLMRSAGNSFPVSLPVGACDHLPYCISHRLPRKRVKAGLIHRGAEQGWCVS